MTTSGLYAWSRPFFSASPIKTAYFTRLSLRKHNVEISGLKVPDRAAVVKLGSADFTIFELKLLERVPKFGIQTVLLANRVEIGPQCLLYFRLFFHPLSHEPTSGALE